MLKANDKDTNSIVSMSNFWKTCDDSLITRLMHDYETNNIDIHSASFMIQAVRKEMAAGASILDVGGGTGAITIPLYDYGYHMTYLDISPQMIKHFEQKRGTRNIPILCQDIFDIHYTNKFDAITCRYVFPHYSDFGALLAAIAPLLNSGGLLFFDSFSADAIYKIAQVKKMDFDIVKKNTLGKLTAIHREDLQKIALSNGFRILRTPSIDMFGGNPYFCLSFENGINKFPDYNTKRNFYYSNPYILDFITFIHECGYYNNNGYAGGVVLNILIKD